MKTLSVNRVRATEDCHRVSRGTSRWTVVVSTIVLAAAILATPVAANADTFAFSFNGGGMSGSGIIAVSPVPVSSVPGAFQITGITGTFSDANLGLSNAAITGVQTTSLPSNINTDGTFIPPGSQADGFPFSFDNLFFPGGNSPAVTSSICGATA